MSGAYVWGVDIAMAHQAFAFAPLDHGDIAVETLLTDSEAREGQRLGWLDRQVRIYARAIATATGRPASGLLLRL